MSWLDTDGVVMYGSERCSRDVDGGRCAGFAHTPSGACVACATAECAARPCPSCGDTAIWPGGCGCEEEAAS